MSKVYIVTSGEYSDYHIDAVFTTREKAEQFCAVHNTCERYSNFYNIEEYDVDESDCTKAEVVYAFHVDPSLKPSVEEVYVIDARNIEKFEEKVKIWQRSGDLLQDYYALGRYVFLKEHNPEKAIRIVLDRIAKAKAEKEGIC